MEEKKPEATTEAITLAIIPIENGGPTQIPVSADVVAATPDERRKLTLNDSGLYPDGSPLADDGRLEEPPKKATARDPKKHNNTNLDAMMHILKGNIGTGILALPSALRKAGLFVGSSSIMLVGFIAVHCMHTLVRCAHHLCEKTGCSALDYNQVVEASFKNGPEKLQRLSKIAKMVVTLFLCLTQIGFCSVYFVFIAENIHQVAEAHTKDVPGLNIIMLATLPLMIAFCWIRNLRTLAIFSTIANILTAGGLIIIFVYVVQDLPHVSTVPHYKPFGDFPAFFGTAVYAFEGISVILPIENQMKNPEDFSGLTGVLNTGMVLVTCLYTSVGFYGYLKFGDDVHGSITLSLPNTPFYQAVKIIFAIAIFFTYGLQFYVPIGIIWPNIKEKINHIPLAAKYGEYLFRSFMVLVTFAMAIAVPHLDLFITFVGAFCGSLLAVAFPALLEIVTFWPDGLGILRWMLYKDIIIFFIGILGWSTGTYSAVYDIVTKMSSNETIPH